MMSHMEEQAIECLKCGGRVGHGESNCPACTWPHAPEGWKRTRIRVHRVTLDTSCINAKQENPHLNQLEQWERQRWVRLERAQAMGEELKGKDRREKAKELDPHPPLFVLGASALGDGSVLAGPVLKEELLARILFPTTKVLSDNHRRDIQHLQELVRTGGDIFVSLDKDFIGPTRREALWRIGIWVFPPNEAVSFLREYGTLPSNELVGHE